MEIVVIVALLVVVAVLALALRGARRPRAGEHAADPVEPPGDALDALKPGMLVRHRDEHLIVERTLHFRNGDERWVEHRLADDRLGRSLWLEIQHRDGLLVTVYERLPGGEDPPAGDGLTRDGVAYTFSERGAARYHSRERAGPGKQGSVEYVEYASGPVRLAYERFDGGRWEVSLGRRVDPSDVEVG